MRKLVEIKDIYTRQFGDLEPIESVRFVKYAKEFLSGVEPEESGYYKWILKKIDIHKTVWGHIETPEHALKRAREFQEIVKSIQNYGYEEEFNNKLKIVNGKIYGGLTAYEEDGKYILIDGSHRISAMNALSIKFCHLLICENNPIPSKPE